MTTESESFDKRQLNWKHAVRKWNFGYGAYSRSI